MSKIPNPTNTAKIYIKSPVKYSSLGTYIDSADGKMIAEVRGWGWIQNLPYAEDVQDNIGKFIAEAINEKLSRNTAEEPQDV